MADGAYATEVRPKGSLHDQSARSTTTAMGCVDGSKKGTVIGIASTTEALKNRWQASGTSLRAGVTDLDLRAFEQRYRVKLPDDFAEYFRSVDGMNEGETDECLLRFWKLEELRPVPEITPVPPKPCEGYFFFADYPLGTHAYAIRLLPGDARIVVIGGTVRVCVADSFSHFLDCYLRGTRASPFGPHDPDLY